MPTDLTIRPANSPCPQRRKLLRYGGAALAMLAVPGLSPRAALPTARRLGFHNLHTGERLRTAYFADGAYLGRQCRAIDHILRDFRTGEVIEIDRQLLDLLYRLRQRTGVDGDFEVISGYRSPTTNEQLRAAGRGVARKSLHTQGRAIDIRLPGADLGRLREAALALRMGGVGYYPRAGFIHVDTGRVRFW